MDFLSPVVGTVTGIEAAQWGDILIYALKVVLFTVPFVLLGLLVERDVVRVPFSNRVIKSLVALLFFTPVFLFGVLNFMAPGMPESFWEKYPFLEMLWIMEGAWPAAILCAVALVYLVLYVTEAMSGDLSR